VVFSGGLIVDVLPSALEKKQEISDFARTDRLLGTMRRAVAALPSIRQWMQDNQSIASAIRQLLRSAGSEVTEDMRFINTRIDFFCRCTKDTILGTLQALSNEDLDSMEQMGHNRVSCYFCAKDYQLSTEDFAKLRQARQQTQQHIA
jgi:redox-regulated HSP33 family molecular chaperone